MKKILLIAPGICPPWTEGRKNFIRDLIPLLQRYANLTMLSTIVGSPKVNSLTTIPVIYSQANTKLTQLMALYHALKNTLKTQGPPDVVVHFPYGSFNGLRGIANQLSIATIHKLVTSYGLPCLTILYSMTGGNLLNLYARFPTLATAQNIDWPGHAVNVGIDMKNKDHFEKAENNQQLLFMAGYHENKASLLKNILYERGLIDIIRIGEQLARYGFQLTISIPLLKHQERRDELLSLLHEMAPSLPVTLEAQVDVYDMFSKHSIYIFPYRTNCNVFIPTSVLEAISVGIPVILSDLPMLQPLIGINNQFCASYSAKQASSLLKSIMYVCQDWDATLARAQRAQEYVKKNWTIEHSAVQIMKIVKLLAA